MCEDALEIPFATEVGFPLHESVFSLLILTSEVATAIEPGWEMG